MSTTKLNHRRFANTKAQGDATKTQEDETKTQEHGTKTQGDETKTQEGTTPKEETTTKKDNWIKPTNDDDNHSPAAVKPNACIRKTWCLTPPDLTCASTKFDDCQRLTQRLSPPGLMTVSAWPNVCLHQTWWLSPPDQNQSSENINLTRPHPNPTALSPKRDYGST